MGLNANSNKVRFHWAYSIKDIFGILLMLVRLIFVSIFYPSVLGDPDN